MEGARKERLSRIEGAGVEERAVRGGDVDCSSKGSGRGGAESCMGYLRKCQCASPQHGRQEYVHTNGLVLTSGWRRRV